MTKRFALVLIFVCMLTIAVAYASAFLPGGAPRAAGWLIAIATAAVMVAVLVLGAARGRGVEHRALRFIFIAVFAVLVLGFGAALAAPPVAAQPHLFLGLPRGAASIMYIVGLLPLLVLPIAYALTFDQTTLHQDELEEIRRKLRELKQDAESHRSREAAR